MKKFILGRLRSFKWAGKGILDLVRNHPNAQVHCLAILVVTPLAFFLGMNAIEWCIIVLCFALVLSMEAMNSGLEYLTDLVSPEHHPLAGKAKDIAAGAVLICSIAAVIVACILFVPKIILLFSTSS